MNQIPLWVPLAVAALGLVGTVAGALGGVLITQRRSDRREALAWDREREHWEREDRLRTFEHRRDAYVAYYAACDAAGRRFSRIGAGTEAAPVGRLTPELDQTVYPRLQEVRLYGTPQVRTVAERLWTLLFAWSGRVKPHDSGSMERKDLDYVKAFVRTEIDLIRKIRMDLGVTDESDSEIDVPAGVQEDDEIVLVDPERMFLKPQGGSTAETLGEEERR